MIRRTIPNAMVLAVLCLALAYRVGVGSVATGLAQSALSMALVAGPALGLFALRVWGGGDAKLLIALAAAFAPAALPEMIVLSAALGGVLAVVVLLAARRGRQAGMPPDGPPDGPTVPYGVALAGGGGIALMAHHVAVLAP